MARTKERPASRALNDAEFYSYDLETELRQCRDEGIDIDPYTDLIRSVSALPPSFHKESLADTVYEMLLGARKIRGYRFREPSDRARIFALCEGGYTDKTPGEDLKERIAGAWYGRIAGCLLGKPLEGIRTDELIPLLKEYWFDEPTKVKDWANNLRSAIK